MAVVPPTLGSYPVERELGRGGMGVVYLARDPRLNRQVAIKVLPDALARDADHLARFEREATLLAALSHSNIAGIYGLETLGATGERLLVLEYVPGETLADRIARGPVPVGEALDIARQIATALEAAHDSGIIHRDLKPANVKVRDDGTVKVLDFGLAKAVRPDTVSGAAMATKTSPVISRQGAVLGTAAYMSPEQARGREVDRRADIWALGAVIFEMLTGRMPFAGDTITDVLASVVTRDPDWHALPAATPPAVRRVLGRCLEKDPKRRMRDAADVRVELEDALVSPVHSSAGQPWNPIDRRRHPVWLAAAAVALLAAGVAVGVGVSRGASGGQADMARTLSLAAPGFNAAVEISPNGEWLAASANGLLQIRRLSDLSWHDAPGVSDIQSSPGAVFWSPDSKFIGFVTDTAIKKIDLVGSRPQAICENCIAPASLRGASWSRDGVILVGGSTAEVNTGLWKVSEGDGRITRVTTLDASRGENSHRFPAFLPDGTRFVFTVRRNNGEHEIRLGSLDGTPPRTVVSAFSQVRYASGHLLFVRNEALVAQPFNLSTGAVAGDPVTILEHVAHSPAVGAARFSVADDGTVVAGGAPDSAALKWFDRRGTALGVLTDVRSNSDARVSADGKRVVMAVLDVEKASSDLYVTDVTSGARTRLTSHANWEESPVWSRDGRVAYRTAYDRAGVYLQDAGGGNERLLFERTPASPLNPLDWSPDGRYVLVDSWTLETQNDLMLIATTGPPEIKPWLATRASESNGRFSPDGRFVAYLSTESGNEQIHVRSFANPAVARRVTTSGGLSPTWSLDGRELFYVDQDQWIVAVAITTGATIETGTPQKLFRIARRDISNTTFDVDPQGRFLVYDVQDSRMTPELTVLHVLLNWTGRR